MFAFVASEHITSGFLASLHCSDTQTARLQRSPAHAFQTRRRYTLSYVQPYSEAALWAESSRICTSFLQTPTEFTPGEWTEEWLDLRHDFSKADPNTNSSR